MPWTLANERLFAGACRVFCPLRVNMPSSKCVPERGTIPVRPLRSPHHFGSASGPEPSFSPAAHATAPLQWKSSTSKVQSLSYIHCLQNYLPQSVPLSLQSIVWEVFFLCKPHPTLSQHLSTFSLPVERVPCAPQHSSFFLSQLVSTHLTPAMFSLSNHGNTSSSPQIDFLGVPSYLTSIHSCSRERKAPGPLLLCHLNSSLSISYFLISDFPNSLVNFF